MSTINLKVTLLLRQLLIELFDCW